MAQKKPTVSSTPNEHTTQEMSLWYEQNKDKLDLLGHTKNFEAAKNALVQVRDLDKSYSSTAQTFNKESLRTYLKNIANNEANLRKLSWFLYYRSHVYARICHYYANMFCLDCYNVIPDYDLTKQIDSTKVQKEFQKTVLDVNHMRLQQEFFPIFLNNFIQDVYYGVCIRDDTGIFHMSVPADYGKIIGKFETGDFAYAIDASWLRSRQELCEYIPHPFKDIWDEYQKTKKKWIPMPEQYCVCTKFRTEDPDVVTPPLVGIFNSIINLTDLEDLQAAEDEASIYKLLWFELETINGSKMPDDWKINPELVSGYYKILQDTVPPYIGTALVPGKLQEVSFNSDQASDTTKVAKATEQVLNTSGGAEVLNGATINNTFAFKMACIANTEYAISSLLPQVQSWVMRMLSYDGADKCNVKFAPVSVYTKSDYRERLLENGQYGIPTKLAIASVDGLNPMDLLSLNNLEENVLGLSDKLIPLNSSYTSSGEAGRPETPDDELTDGGERSRGNAG